MTLLVEHAHITSNNDPKPKPKPKANPNPKPKPNPNHNFTTGKKDTRKVQAIVILSTKIDKFFI